MADFRVVVHDRFDDAAWRDYERVYEASWKPAEGSPEMIRALAEQEGAAGTLRLGLAYLDGQPVASQLWLVENGIATIHKLAYAEEARQFSPGTVLSVEMFRRALDVDRVETIDFGIGSDAYKAEWMSESEPLYMLTAYDLLSLRGIAGAARAAAAKLVPVLRSQ
jgi:CelD/BcsL family acetyltransferase involved in cellulose biosynthesis